MSDIPSVEGDTSSDSVPSANDRIVVRDSTFARSTADQIAPVFLGRDFELMCLQASPTITALKDRGAAWEPEGDSVYAEVARIRVSFSVAVQLAVAILNQGIELKRLDAEEVVKSIRVLAAEQPPFGGSETSES